MIFESKSNQEVIINLLCNIIERRYRVKINPQMFNNALELFGTICQHLNSLPENLVKEYLQHAEIDYKSAKLLYDNKIYPSMAFHIQQSVEKLAKAYALYLGVIKRNELRPRRNRSGIGHESPVAFILILKKKGAIDLILLVFAILGLKRGTYESIKKDIEDFERFLEKRKELAKISKVEIQSLVLKGEEIVNKLRKIDPRKVRAEIRSVRLSFNADARRMGLPIDGTTQELFSIPSNLNVIKGIFEMLILFVKLYILAIITFPHSFYPRYPYEELPLADYKEGLGIVDYAGELLNTIEETIKKHESLGLDANFVANSTSNSAQEVGGGK